MRARSGNARRNRASLLQRRRAEGELAHQELGFVAIEGLKDDDGRPSGVEVSVEDVVGAEIVIGSRGRREMKGGFSSLRAYANNSLPAHAEVMFSGID